MSGSRGMGGGLAWSGCDEGSRHLELIGIKELVRDVGAKDVACASRRNAPSLNIIVGV